MENLINFINEYKSKYGKKSFLLGSYVYNKLLKNIDDYEDIDIIVNDVDLFYDLMKKKFNDCMLLSGRVGEYSYYSWIKVKCANFDKTINVLDKIDHDSLINQRDRRLFDFQRILYDGKDFSTFDKELNLQQVIDDYKNNLYCYQPLNLRDKDKNRFNLQRKNFIKCWRDNCVFKKNLKSYK